MKTPRFTRDVPPALTRNIDYWLASTIQFCNRTAPKVTARPGTGFTE